ncbi:MAG: hypothetical protein KDG50_01750 [Chromatiales bacterium]|nr:hypothetical protein [Chromatiales bacterium]
MESLTGGVREIVIPTGISSAGRGVWRTGVGRTPGRDSLTGIATCAGFGSAVIGLAEAGMGATEAGFGMVTARGCGGGAYGACGIGAGCHAIGAPGGGPIQGDIGPPCITGAAKPAGACECRDRDPVPKLKQKNASATGI